MIFAGAMEGLSSAPPVEQQLLPETTTSLPLLALVLVLEEPELEEAVLVLVELVTRVVVPHVLPPDPGRVGL